VTGGTTYTVTAVGETSGSTASTALAVTLDPQLTVNPSSVMSGSSVSISGQNFPPYASTTITAQIPLVSGASQAISQTRLVGADGTFLAQVPVLSAAASGSVTFTAVATALSSAQTYTASSALSIINSPATVSAGSLAIAPGNQVTVAGTNFSAGPNALITINLTYAGSSGQETATQTIDASTTGTFSAILTVPTDAVSSSATLTASQAASGQTASTTLTIQAPLPTATPTSTPVPPTPTPTNTPTATPTDTPIPPTATPTTVPVHLEIKTASLWYGTVRAGTFDHVSIQTNKKMRLPVTLRVTFPSGKSELFRGFTTANGGWSLTFSVPASAVSRSNSFARILVTVTRNFAASTRLTFAVIR
jgi:hypothetical protein